jgi:hypothetical protein
MMKSRLMMAATMAGLMAMSPGAIQPALPTPQVNVSKKQRRTLFGSMAQPKALVGIRQSRRTVAMDKRAATKKRNQRRAK